MNFKTREEAEAYVKSVGWPIPAPEEAQKMYERDRQRRLERKRRILAGELPRRITMRLKGGTVIECDDPVLYDEDLE